MFVCYGCVVCRKATQKLVYGVCCGVCTEFFSKRRKNYMTCSHRTPGYGMGGCRGGYGSATDKPRGPVMGVVQPRHPQTYTPFKAASTHVQLHQTPLPPSQPPALTSLITWLKHTRRVRSAYSTARPGGPSEDCSKPASTNSATTLACTSGWAPSSYLQGGVSAIRVVRAGWP